MQFDVSPGGATLSLTAHLASSTEPREGKFTYPGHLELYWVRVSPVHEGGVHLTARAHATVPVVDVKAASTALLETEAIEDPSPRCQKPPSQAPLVPCSDAMHTASVPRTLSDDDNKSDDDKETLGSEGKDDGRFHLFNQEVFIRHLPCV